MFFSTICHTYNVPRRTPFYRNGSDEGAVKGKRPDGAENPAIARESEIPAKYIGRTADIEHFA